MLKTIARKELLENVLSYRFPLFFIICAVMILSSFYVKQLQIWASGSATTGSRSGCPGKSWSWPGPSTSTPARIPLRGFLPPSPLARFAAGFEASLPKYYEFTADGSRPGDTAVAEESILSIFGRLDFLSILQIVVSLIVLPSPRERDRREKEMGTLRAILANGVPRHSVLLGKYAGGLTAVWMTFLVVVLVGIILSACSGFPLAQRDSRPASAIFLGASLFLLSYYGLGLLISASSSRSRTALVASLLVWIVLQLAVPRLSDMVAAVVRPIPTETVISMQKSVAVKTIDNEKAHALGRRYEELFGRGTGFSTEPEPAANRPAWEAFLAETETRASERKAAELREIESAFRRQKAGQRAVASNLALISPSSAVTRLLTDLCGTGEIDRGRYLDAVQSHQRTLDAELYSHVRKTTVVMPSGGTASSSSIDKLIDPKTLPAFAFRRAGVGEILAGNAGSLISLAFWLIIPFAAAYIRFLKYDVR